MDWTEVSDELRKKLDPKHVKSPDGKFGPKGDYLEGWHVINEANEIFGFNGWSYTIDLQRDDLRKVEVTKTWNGQSKTEEQWQAAYTCICTLTVDGVTRQDVGFGSGFAKGVGDALEGATKEAATDALKRALRTFGNRFGLALYDKSRENVGVDAPPPNHPATRDRIKAKLEKQAALSDLAEAWRAEWPAIQTLPPPMRAELTAAKDKRKSVLSDEVTSKMVDEGHVPGGGEAAFQ